MASWINAAYCFEQYSQGAYAFTWGYCTGNLLIEFVSTVLLAQTIALLVWQLDRAGWCSRKTWADVKTWLFLLMTVYLLLVVLKYTFTLYNTGAFYNAVQVLTPMLGAVVFYLVCYHFTTKATDLIGDDKRTVKFLQIFGVAMVLAFVLLAAFQAVKFTEASFDANLLCKYPAFIIPAVINLVISFLFVYVGWKTTRSLNDITESLLSQQEGTRDSMNASREMRRTSASLESIGSAKKNMWLIIISITVINVYSALYSMALLAEPAG